MNSESDNPRLECAECGTEVSGPYDSHFIVETEFGEENRYCIDTHEKTGIRESDE